MNLISRILRFTSYPAKALLAAIEPFTYLSASFGISSGIFLYSGSSSKYCLAYGGELTALSLNKSFIFLAALLACYYTIMLA